MLSHDYAADRAQTVGVTRDDIASALAFATIGVRAGTLLEDERQIPIIARQSAASRDRLENQVLFAQGTGEFIPLEQVTDGLRSEVQDTVFMRRDRVPTITVQAAIGSDETPAAMHARLRDEIEAIELPIGYRVEWLLVPMSVNGVTLGLLGTGLPFSFTALLGLLSLSGMLIKNGIVLVEEIDLVRRTTSRLDEAIVAASVSRLRPVFLAAVTTILGMTPLLSDAFFASMAVTIMAGLAFASLLTMIAAPVLYYLFFPAARRRDRDVGAAGVPDAGRVVHGEPAW